VFIVSDSCNLDYNESVKSLIQLLEVLKDFDNIQDMNYRQFMFYCESAVKNYSDETAELVLSEMKYQKRTISFLKKTLDFYGIRNDLSKRLSPLSEYKHPRKREMYR